MYETTTHDAASTADEASPMVRLRHALTWAVAGLLLSPYIAAPLTALYDEQVDQVWGLIAFAAAAAAIIARWHWPAKTFTPPSLLFTTAYSSMFAWLLLWMGGTAAWRHAAVAVAIAVAIYVLQAAPGRAGHGCHVAAVVALWGLAVLGLLAHLIGLVLMPVAVGMTISVRQRPQEPRPRRPWAPVPPHGLRRVRIAAQILTYTQAPVAVFLGMFAFALLGRWFYGFVILVAPPFLLTGALFVRAASRVREPHLGWRWHDLALTLTVLGGGTYLWLFGLWRARGDVDPLKGFWFCVAAVWLLSVAAAAGLILRSWLPWNRRARSLHLDQFSELR